MNANLDERLQGLLGGSEVVTRLDGRGKAFVITPDELLFLDDATVQRADLKNVSRVVVEKTGSISVSTPAGTAIQTTIRDFDLTELKFFFEQVKAAIANSKAHGGPDRGPAVAQSVGLDARGSGRGGAAAELDVGGEPIPEGHETLIDGVRDLSFGSRPPAPAPASPPPPAPDSPRPFPSASAPAPAVGSVPERVSPAPVNPFAEDEPAARGRDPFDAPDPFEPTASSVSTGGSLTLTPVPPSRPSPVSDLDRGPRPATSSSVRTGERASGEVPANPSAWDGDVLDPRASLETPPPFANEPASRPSGVLARMAAWLRVMAVLTLLVGVAAGALLATTANTTL
ncbi:MAG TPA: hypothetical protein VHN99_10355, partial [Deinococcales bacterium]|nr:hypothetical protein [Deinococcales bacterium]